MIARACLIVSICWVAPLLLPEIPAWAQDCKRCEDKQELSDHKAQEITEQTEYLGKNRVFLAGVSPTESARLKVEGNIQLIVEKIAQLRKEMHELDSQLEAEGCDACESEPASF